MLKYSQTTVFNVNTQTIVNTVNCMGVMGAGLALEFKLRFPQMYADYVKRCRRGEITVGKVSLYQEENLPNIINFPTKDNWKYPSNLAWIESGLRDFIDKYQKWGITSIAFPKLGCDRGGLQWSQVNSVMEKYLTSQDDLEVYICLDNETQAQGVEKQMLDLLSQPEILQKELNLTTYQQEKIIQALPLPRFRNLAKIYGISKDKYQDIFKALYIISQETVTISSQRHLSFSTINQDIFTLTDVRLRLVLFLQSIGLNAQEISKLLRDDLIKQSKDLIISLPEKPGVVIPWQMWEKLKVNLDDIEAKNPLIAHKNQSEKPLKPTTIKKLISTGNKLLKKQNCQQLTLFG